MNATNLAVVSDREDSPQDGPEEERSSPVAAAGDEWEAGRRQRPQPVPNPGPLSPREREILGLTGRGFTPKEVAFELGVSHATVRVLIARAMRKLGRAPRAQRARR
jgi:DNA-binding NarL/FixJ family response regulator